MSDDLARLASSVCSVHPHPSLSSLSTRAFSLIMLLSTLCIPYSETSLTSEASLSAVQLKAGYVSIISTTSHLCEPFPNSGAASNSTKPSSSKQAANACLALVEPPGTQPIRCDIPCSGRIWNKYETLCLPLIRHMQTLSAERQRSYQVARNSASNST